MESITHRKDIAWWDVITKFICSTNDKNAIYIVGYASGRFDIIFIIGDNQSYISALANFTHLFMWISSSENDYNGIEIYSINFEYIWTIS